MASPQLKHAEMKQKVN